MWGTVVDANLTEQSFQFKRIFLEKNSEKPSAMWEWTKLEGGRGESNATTNVSKLVHWNHMATQHLSYPEGEINPEEGQKKFNQTFHGWSKSGVAGMP